MSIRSRRDSLSKSSLGIDSIRKSIISLSEGLVSIGKQSRELIKQTRRTNLLKSKLIRQDAEFFKKRRENVLRKQREDELEASSVTGVSKKQGNIIQRSTKGFLGRILDFVGTLILGWALINLPKIISAFQKLFGLINRVVSVFTGFISGMRNFFQSLGEGVDNFLSQINRFDFREDDKNIRETLDKTEQNLTKLNKDFAESVQTFARDKDIASADKVAADLGITEGAGDDNIIPADDFVMPEVDTSENLQQNDEEIEGRVDGGDVVEGVPYFVGENPDGTLNETSELFVPEQSGTIIPNDELVAQNTEGMSADSTNIEGVVADSIGDSNNVEGVSVEEEPSSITPSKSAYLENDIASMSSNDDVVGQDMMSIRPRDVEKIIPKKRMVNNLKGRRKPRMTMIISNQNTNSVPQVPNISQSSTKIVSSGGHSSNKILLDFQSVMLK
tara:strand:+ start:458 stop:1792 length:1335 start_codon:yes stop_codon:yes gene_type:complete